MIAGAARMTDALASIEQPGLPRSCRGPQVGLYTDMWNRQFAEREEGLDEAAE